MCKISENFFHHRIWLKSDMRQMRTAQINVWPHNKTFYRWSHRSEIWRWSSAMTTFWTYRVRSVFISTIKPPLWLLRESEGFCLQRWYCFICILRILGSDERGWEAWQDSWGLGGPQHRRLHWSWHHEGKSLHSGVLWKFPSW